MKIVDYLIILIIVLFFVTLFVLKTKYYGYNDAKELKKLKYRYLLYWSVILLIIFVFSYLSILLSIIIILILSFIFLAYSGVYEMTLDDDKSEEIAQLFTPVSYYFLLPVIPVLLITGIILIIIKFTNNDLLTLIFNILDNFLILLIVFILFNNLYTLMVHLKMFKESRIIKYLSYINFALVINFIRTIFAILAALIKYDYIDLQLNASPLLDAAIISIFIDGVIKSIRKSN